MLSESFWKISVRNTSCLYSHVEGEVGVGFWGLRFLESGGVRMSDREMSEQQSSSGLIFSKEVFVLDSSLELDLFLELVSVVSQPELLVVQGFSLVQLSWDLEFSCKQISLGLWTSASDKVSFSSSKITLSVSNASFFSQASKSWSARPTVVSLRSLKVKNYPPDSLKIFKGLCLLLV